MGQISEYGESRDTWTPAGAASDRETATDAAAENRATAERTPGLTTGDVPGLARVDVTGDGTREDAVTDDGHDGTNEAEASDAPGAGQGEETPNQ